MDLALSESEQLLKDAARQFVRQEAGRPVLTALDDPASGEAAGPWRPEWLPTFAAAGWLGLFVPAWCIWDDKRQGLHDKAVDSIVIEDLPAPPVLA